MNLILSKYQRLGLKSETKSCSSPNGQLRLAPIPWSSLHPVLKNEINTRGQG